MGLDTNVIVVAAVSQEEVDAIEELKTTHELIHTSLQSDLTLTQARYLTERTDNELQKSQLIAALLSKDKISKELADLKGTAVAPDSQEKNHAKARVEQEAAQKALEEVRQQHKEQDSKVNKSPKRKGFFKAFSRLSLRPYTTKEAPPTPSDISDGAGLQAAEQVIECERHIYTELELERSVIGSLPIILQPLISPRTVPLPMSPSKNYFPRNIPARHRSSKNPDTGLTTFSPDQEPKRKDPGSPASIAKGASNWPR
jgi:hypothetical protein